jgi:hypothetical protein
VNQDQISAIATQEMWREKHVWNVSVLRTNADLQDLYGGARYGSIH